MFDALLPRLLPALALVAAVALTGCGHRARSLDSPQSSTDNFQKAQAAGIRPVAVGEFGSERNSRPVEARYLKDTLSTELQGAGLLDPASSAVVEGKLLSVELGGNRAVAAARFTITLAGGRVVYDRDLRVTHTWSSGANMAREHRAVYSKLVGALFTDPAFKNAVAR